MSICVDLRLSSADLPVCGPHRRVPSRTLLFFCSIFEALDFWTRLRWVTLLRRRLAIVDGSKATDFHIDKRWDSRLSALVQKVLHVETELWRLSTLGGAVSAMGFFSRKFIRHAFVISIRQLRLAIQIGDPVLISRCFLYISLAFAQKGQFLPALKIVRQEWNRGIELRSAFLLNCTRGVWSTIKWLMMNRKMMMLK
ncbi:hypothetical protein niasHT_014621 [Heterodera trifolii]|uniref:Uncharacterized protein n=1 Tax=Heterodera trifolii TaxID=157864 RepID=A0ABD2LIS4_9BILA